MSVRILTLFGEEISPETMIAVGKGSAKARLSTKEDIEKNKDAIIPIVMQSGWKAEKNYYSIGEVAALFSVKASHIRHWTNKFELAVRTTQKGDRLFSPDNITQLKAIYHMLKQRGLTISGAKLRLSEDQRLSLQGMALKKSLLHLRNKLLQIRNQLA